MNIYAGNSNRRLFKGGAELTSGNKRSLFFRAGAVSNIAIGQQHRKLTDRIVGFLQLTLQG